VKSIAQSTPNERISGRLVAVPCRRVVPGYRASISQALS